MNVQIITKNFHLNIYGFGGLAINKDYVGMAFSLSGKMWEIIKANDIKNKGKNIWVYENNDRVFTGVELENFSETDCGLEQHTIQLKKYAYYKHIGPYHLIKRVGQEMTNALTDQRFEVIRPYIEIYGHWKSDETQLETELLMSLK